MGKIGRRAHVKEVQRGYNKLEREKRSSIKRTIKKLKGTRFTDQFVCDICKHNRITGYLFITEDSEYEICKFCYDAIFDVRPHTKVLYTPMGNKR